MDVETVVICRYCHHVRILLGHLISEIPTIRIFTDTCSHCGAEYRTMEKVTHPPKADAEGIEKIRNVNR